MFKLRFSFCASLLLVLCLVFSLSFSQSYASAPATARGEMTWTNNLHSLDQLQVQYDASKMSARIILLTENMPYTNELNISYGCGFFCYGLNCDGFLFATFLLIYSGDGSLSYLQMVWSANRDRLVHENATLRLTSTGNLVLNDTDGTIVWSSNTYADSFEGMTIQDSGNLVLFNSSNKTLWQSFDHPTDTLLLGQKWKVGMKLISNISPTNTSQGSFYTTLFHYGVARFVGLSQPRVYYRYPLKPPNVSIAYVQFDTEYLSFYPEEGSHPIPGLTFEVPKNTLYVKIESDGHLPYYLFGEQTGISAVDYTLGFNAQTKMTACDYPTNCGEYGICSNDNCSCPQGENGADLFSPIDDIKQNSGCHPLNPLVCSETYPSRGVEFLELQHVSYFTYLWENASIRELVTTDDCKSLCLKNCSCKAAFFRYDGNFSHGYCYLESKVYSVKLNTNPNDRFYNSTAYIKFKSSSKGNNYSVVVISVAVTSAALVAVLLLWVWLSKIRKCRKEKEEDEEHLVDLPSGVPCRYSFKDLERATNHFKTKLGSGGFGSVFEGVLPEGTKIAVKRLDGVGQGAREFRAEVETLGNIHHFHLVRLKGFCAEKSHRMLVYEHLPNGSLDKWIFSNNNQNNVLDWKTRYKVALHIARGLTYLHEECEERIIHFDVKPQNILLDQNFNAKVSDFGLSKLINRDQTEIVTRVRGTPGYMAPELLKGHVTEKADVYSFGVMLVEIASGKRNKEFATLEESLFSLLQHVAEQGRLVELIDPQLREEGMEVQEKALGMIGVGMRCVQDDFGSRPRMSTVVKALEGLTDEGEVASVSSMDSL